MELNNLGAGACRFPRKLQLHTQGTAALGSSLPLQYRIVGGHRGGAGPQGACQSNEGAGPSKSLGKLGKLIGPFEKTPGPPRAHANTVPGE